MSPTAAHSRSLAFMLDVVFAPPDPDPPLECSGNIWQQADTAPDDAGDPYEDIT